MGNVDKVRVKGEFYNIVSPSAFGDYIETIGGACTNPNGYAKDAIFLAKTYEVQNLYQATQAIAFGANIVVGTNCKQTTLDEVIKSMSGASTASDVSYSNTSSGLTATDAQAAIDEVNGKTNTNANNISSLNSALTNEAATRSAMGAKNLLPFTMENIKAINTNGTWNGNSYTYNGITYVVSEDGVIEASGTNNTGVNSVFYLVTTEFGLQFNFKLGRYKLNGCPAGGSDQTYSWYVAKTGQYNSDYGSGVTFEVTSETDNYWSLISVKTGTALEGTKTFKPMVWLASDADNTFQPYAKTNRELMDDVESITKQTGGLISYGIRNWANDSATIELPRLGGLLVGGRADMGFAIYICENSNELAVLAGSDFVSASISGKTLSLTFTSHRGTTFNYKYINSLDGLV